MRSGKHSAKIPKLPILNQRSATTTKDETRTILLTGAPRRRDLTWRKQDLTAPLLRQFGGSAVLANAVIEEEHEKEKWDVLYFNTNEAVIADDVGQSIYSANQDNAEQVKREPSFELGEQESGQRSASPRGTFDDSILKDEDFFTQNRPPSKSFYALKSVSAKKMVKSKHCIVTDLDFVKPDTSSRDMRTVNMLGVVLSLSTPRPVRTRSKAQSSLLELTFADETCPSFKISIWFSTATFAEKQLRARCESLRIGDLVLFERLSVKKYRGKIYAQSTRGTKVWDITNGRWSDGILDKVGRVRSWMVEHVVFASSALSKDGDEMMEVDGGDIDGATGNMKERRSDPADSRPHRQPPTRSPHLELRTRRRGRSAADELPEDTQPS